MTSDYIARIKAGWLYRHALLTEDEVAASADVLARIDLSELETIRVLFADQHGILRGKTLVSSAFHTAFTSGIKVPSTLLLKDTAHKTAFPVWSGSTDKTADLMRGAQDIVLTPDLATFRVLPWSSHSAWILCGVASTSGEPIPVSSTAVLQRALAGLDRKGLALDVGLEVEFHVFQTVVNKVNHSDTTMPGQPHETRAIAQGYQLLTETRYAELETVMDDLRRNCQAMQLPVRSMEVEMGPSQFEFTFEPADPMTHAHNMMMFRTMVKEVCAMRGLHATFMCRPRVENGAASGWHLHQSLVDKNSGRNLFMPDTTGELTTAASQWIAGLLKYAEESCLLTTPTVNGYKRYQPLQLAPDRIQWGLDNRGAMIRALLTAGDRASRVENRVAEPAANPYYFFASQILSGLAGIDEGLSAPAATETPYAGDARRLPANMIDAITAFESGNLYRMQVGPEFVDYLACIKHAEWDRYLQSVSVWEQAEYFSLY